MANINSFAENMNKTTEAVTNALKLISAYGESATTNESTIKVTLVDGTVVEFPSTANLNRRMERAENTIAAFTKNQGIIETDDDTYRKLKVETVPKAPGKITGLSPVTEFHIDSNWFFEDLMFPKCVVKIDLKGKIDNDSDRIYINRVILDYKNQNAVEFYNNVISGDNANPSYTQLIELLNTNEIPYSEDTQEVNIPLSYEKYNGEFTISAIKLEGNDLWYYLDTLNYKQIDSNGLTVSSSYLLSVGDSLRYNDSLFTVTEIDQNAKKIKIQSNVGYESPAVNNAFYYYNDPFTEKTADIAIGYNEINIIYIKAINENYNILSKDWSEPIKFITNNLIKEGTTTALSAYYPNFVMDFGKEMIARAKQNSIYASDGLEPNAPVIDANALQVVQINTQLEATLSTEEYNNLTSSILSVKSTVEDLRKNIIANKEALIKEKKSTNRTTLQNKITNDTESLSTYTTQYNSLVDELNTLLTENGALSYSPKYHIRGFFPIPSPKYADESNLSGKQEVIGFDIMYRYIHTDETSTTLNSFKYSDAGTTVNAVFSDWVSTTSKIREQVYDDDLGIYIWEDEEVGNGSIININQIDIPIRSGEKVEIKVRSISEAGYPVNPLKSKWSDSVIISFPSNLTTNDSATNIINSAKDDKTAVVLQNTLSSAGLYTHLSDSTEQYKHSADNIYIVVDGTNGNKVTKSLSEYLSELKELITAKTK